MKTEITLELILKSPKLPSLPSIALQILELSKDEDSELSQYAEEVRKDPALSTRVLKTVNSPTYGMHREILSIDQAVSILGRRRTMTQVLGFYLTDDATSWPMIDHYERYWLRSAVMAASCEHLAEVRKIDDDVDYFLVGLLLDVGQLAILKTCKELYWQTCELAYSDSQNLFELEREAFGFDHAVVGGEMLKAWGLPEKLTTLVATHHDEPSNPESEICVMASLCGDYFASNRRENANQEITMLVKKCQWVRDDGISEMLEAIEQKTRTAAAEMSINAERLPCASDIMSEAIETLIDTHEVHAKMEQPVCCKKAASNLQNHPL